MEIALSEIEECVSSTVDVERELFEADLTKIIDNFLSELPKQQRIIFVRRYWYLSTIAEISSEYGLTQSMVKSVLFRLRNKLKLYLEKEGITF